MSARPRRATVARSRRSRQPWTSAPAASILLRIPHLTLESIPGSTAAAHLCVCEPCLHARAGAGHPGTGTVQQSALRAQSGCTVACITLVIYCFSPVVHPEGSSNRLHSRLSAGLNSFMPSSPVFRAACAAGALMHRCVRTKPDRLAAGSACKRRRVGRPCRGWPLLRVPRLCCFSTVAPGPRLSYAGGGCAVSVRPGGAQAGSVGAWAKAGDTRGAGGGGGGGAGVRADACEPGAPDGHPGRPQPPNAAAGLPCAGGRRFAALNSLHHQVPPSPSLPAAVGCWGAAAGRAAAAHT